jgi:hypothetical protein
MVVCCRWVAGVGVGDSGVVGWRLLEYRIVVGRRRGCGGFRRSVWGSFVVWFGLMERKIIKEIKL